MLVFFVLFLLEGLFYIHMNSQNFTSVSVSEDGHPWTRNIIINTFLERNLVRDVLMRPH